MRQEALSNTQQYVDTHGERVWITRSKGKPLFGNVTYQSMQSLTVNRTWLLWWAKYWSSSLTLCMVECFPEYQSLCLLETWASMDHASGALQNDWPDKIQVGVEHLHFRSAFNLVIWLGALDTFARMIRHFCAWSVSYAHTSCDLQPDTEWFRACCLSYNCLCTFVRSFLAKRSRAILYKL